MDAPRVIRPAGSSVPTPDPTPARPTFAHASEAELARILDFYEVEWAYEPTVFPLRWSLAGEVVESFAPDFYLPEVDLYLEMTTLRQKLVRKKNRKLRRLRELYPDVRIKLFYARDFRALMLKYGKLAIADGLTGAEGQVGPDRALDEGVVAGPSAARSEADASPIGPAIAPAPPRQRSTGHEVTAR
jgi:hypoxanthine phosphoribosyltransferase